MARRDEPRDVAWFSMAVARRATFSKSNTLSNTNTLHKFDCEKIVSITDTVWRRIVYYSIVLQKHFYF